MKVSEIEFVDTNMSKNFIQYQIPKKVKEVNKSDIQSLIKIKKTVGIARKITLVMKRVIDIIGAIIGILILIPLSTIVAMMNFLCKENGPVFYTQERIGKDGKRFKMFKFRTMVVDADKKLNDLLEKNPELKKEWDENRKLKNDPRITKIGKLLRKTSLDEFPQFVNVLLGNMSLVGPRAVVDDEIEKFGGFAAKVLSVKPGITGYWAANGRSDTSYEERVLMEATYVDKFSIIFDLKIMFKTIFAVIRKDGAM